MYYEEIKLKIIELIKNNELDKALILIGEELQMPYIPADFELFLNEKKAELTYAINDKIKNKSGAFTLDEFKDILLNDLDPITQAFAIKEIGQLNIRIILDEIQSFLINEKMIPENKTFLMMTLNYQQVDHEFKMIKNNKTYSINPNSFDFAKSEKILNEIEKELTDTIGVDNPTLSNVCFGFVLSYFLITFPELMSEEIKPNLIAAAIKQGYEAYGMEHNFDEIKNTFNFDINKAENIFLEFKKYKIGDQNED